MSFFGRKIESRRVELGLTNLELAEAMGFSVKRLSALKRQEGSRVSAAILRRLAEALRMDPIFLLPDTPNGCGSEGAA